VLATRAREAHRPTVDAGDEHIRQLTLRDESDLVVARRHVRELGKAQGVAAVGIEALATAVTEIARNVLIHARSGQVSLRGARGSRAGIERNLVVVVVRDDGPGIANVEAAMVDGYSTGEGLGMGLSGARRMVDVFELRSVVGEGTTITLEKWGAAHPDHL
jgi:serine/threonine-protein kinase RsbT